MNLGQIKSTVDNMVRDIRELRDGASAAPSKKSTKTATSVSSSTEDLSDTVSDSCTSFTSATPSALSRTAKNVAQATDYLNESQIAPMITRSRKSLQYVENHGKKVKN